jgi:hypothetical protein
MAIQLDVASRNARLDTIESTAGNSCTLEIRTGAQPANCAAASTGTVLVTIDLPADWMNAASAGAKTYIATWQDASADASGVGGHFRIYNDQTTKDGTTCFMQGSCGEAAEDLVLDNSTIAAGQQVTITQFTLTDGNA